MCIRDRGWRDCCLFGNGWKFRLVDPVLPHGAWCWRRWKTAWGPEHIPAWRPLRWGSCPAEIHCSSSDLADLLGAGGRWWEIWGDSQGAPGFSTVHHGWQYQRPWSGLRKLLMYPCSVLHFSSICLSTRTMPTVPLLRWNHPSQTQAVLNYINASREIGHNSTRKILGPSPTQINFQSWKELQ